MKMLNNRKSLVRAVRLVVESLESRRLLTSVSSIDFDASGTDQHLSVTFDGPVVATTMPPATVVNLTQFAADVPLQTPTLSASQTVATYKPVSNLFTNGWYESYVHDAAATVADDPELTFSVLNTDFNSDGVVNFNDFMVLQNNFGQSGKTFADGDANYDHVVNFNDYLALQNSFGQLLPDLPNNAGGVVVANTTAHALDVGWTASDTEPRDGFKIYRSDDGGATYNLVQTLGDPDARAWQDVGENDDIGTPLITGHKYWYRVRAFTLEAGASASVTRAWGIPTDTTAASPFSASVNPSTVAPNEPFTLTLSATAAEAPAVTAWKITWQNGDTQTLTAGPDSSNATQSNWLLTHSYAIGGQHFIIIQAQDATGWHDPIGVTVNVTNTPPQVTGTDSYTTSTTSASLSVTGTDDGGAQHLNYQWSVESAPTGGTASLSPASGHAANNTTVNFNKAGDYLLTVTATDTFGLASDPFEVSVSVLQAPQYIDLSPYSANLNLGATKQFTAYAFDQFDQLISAPNVTWSADYGTIDASGLYTATGADSDGTDTVHVALAGDPSNCADASINVTLPAPTGLSVNAPNETEVNLTWSDNSIGESGFVIERSDGNGSTFSPVLTTPPNATGWSLVGLTPEESYRFRISAVVGGLTSAVSGPSSVTMPAIPEPPEGDVLGTVTPSISSDAKSFFSGGPFPAGSYFLRYMGGGLDYGDVPDPGDPVYYASAYNGYGYRIAFDGNASIEAPANFGGYPSVSALSDANTGKGGGFSTSTENPIGVYLEDHGAYGGSGNIRANNGPGATFQLETMPPVEFISTVSIAPADEEGSAEAWEVPLGSNQDSTLKFTVTRTGDDDNGDLDQALTVSLHPPAGTAKSGDYTGLPASVTIPPHESSKTFTVTATENEDAIFLKSLALCLKADSNYRLANMAATATIHPPLNLKLNLVDTGDKNNALTSSSANPDDKILYVPVAYNNDTANGQPLPFKVGEFDFSFSGSIDPALEANRLLWKIDDPTGVVVLSGTSNSKNGTFGVNSTITRHFQFSNPTANSSARVEGGYDENGNGELDGNEILAAGTFQFFDVAVKELSHFSGVDPGTDGVRRSPAILVLNGQSTKFEVSIVPAAIAANVVLSAGSMVLADTQAKPFVKSGANYIGEVVSTGDTVHSRLALPILFKITDPKSNNYSKGRDGSLKVVVKPKGATVRNVHVRIVDLPGQHLETVVPSQAALATIFSDIFGSQTPMSVAISDYQVVSFNYDLNQNGVFDAGGNSGEFSNFSGKGLSGTPPVPGGSDIYLVFVNAYSPQMASDGGAAGELVLSRYAFVDVSASLAAHNGQGNGQDKIATVAAHEVYHSYPKRHNEIAGSGLMYPIPANLPDYSTQILLQEDW